MKKVLLLSVIALALASCGRKNESKSQQEKQVPLAEEIPVKKEQSSGSVAESAFQGNPTQQPSVPNNAAPNQVVSASGSPNGWVHVNSRQGNYGNINHAYVLASSLNNNKIQVKEVIEGGQRNGSHYTYWMEASCSDGMIRMASNVQQFGANNRFIGENPPSSPGWYRATGQKDPAVWNYICRR